MIVIAVDMGGTNIRTGLFTSPEKPQRRRTETHCGILSPQEMIDKVILEVRSIVQEEGLDLCKVKGVGVGFPGHLDFKRGVTLTSSNLPQWENISLRDILEERLKIPVSLDNDANLGALAEHRFGAGTGTRNMIYVTVSSGIGAGIIIDGKIYRGSWGKAAEIGHTSLDINGPLCACGQRGCLMAVASGIGIANLAKGAVRKGKKTLIGDLVQNDFTRINAEVIAEAARQGDKFAENLLEQVQIYLGTGLANLIQILDPEMIVVGGGLCEAKETFLESVIEITTCKLPEQLRPFVRIVHTALGSDSGIIGAASLAIDSNSQNRQRRDRN